jgi:subtilisin family serine protease
LLVFLIYLHTKINNMYKVLTACLLLSLFFACSKNNSTTETVEQLVVNEDLMSRAELNEFIKNTFVADGKFEWIKANDVMIWSAGQQTDKVFSIGFKPANSNLDIKDQIHNIDIANAEWASAKQQILQTILNSEKIKTPTMALDKLQAYQEEVLPIVNVYIEDLKTIKLLRASNLVRYVEPMSYEPGTEEILGRVNSSSGCNMSPVSTTLTSNDYTTIAPNTKQGWNHSYHNVSSAWNKGATGQGVKVFIIDSGISPDQDNMGSAFNQGSSSGRSIEKIFTLPRSSIFGIPYGAYETPNDGCGHGTAMAGACAAPRGTDGNAVGIAYNSNLVTCRATEDVFLDASKEVKGVSDAYINAANRADVKVISMSLGRITSSGQITDAINYAYNKGKLMFCAGGTSFGWSAGWVGVIFPAWLGNVNAVTGIKDNLSTRCNSCHSGSEIDFTVVMERGDEVHPLTLSTANSNSPATVGGSSVATASCAGMAAVVWSKFPNYSRDQVLNKMIVASSNYPNKNGSFGWGNVNLNTATN